jgi:hypothetical protein
MPCFLPPSQANLLYATSLVNQEYDHLMRRLTVIALLLAGIALPACAQRGGSYGGSRGGFSNHSAPASRASSAFHPGFRPSAPMRSSPMRSDPMRSSAVPRHPGNIYPGAPRGYTMGSPGNRSARPMYLGGRNGGYDNHRPPYRPPYRPAYGIQYGVPPGWAGYAPWLGLGYWDYPQADDSGYEDSQAAADQAPPYYNGYDPQSDPQFAGPDYGQQAQPRPYYQPSAPALPQEAVTLVFKDGRPSEQIHNYLLSRDSISIWDQHPREIPLSQLDLEATEKVNRDAGVDFNLPGAPNSPHPTRPPGRPAAGRQQEPPPAHVTI